MAKSALKLKQEKDISFKETYKASLDNHKLKSSLDSDKTELSPAAIAIKVKNAAKLEPINTINTFNRSLKTKDTGKIAIAVAKHFYGKYKVPSYLTNAWDLIIEAPVVAVNNRVNTWRRNREVANGNVNDKISSDEILVYCRWYAIAASGGSLWKYINSTSSSGSTLTKKEVHAFLNCPLKDATPREAIIYAIAFQQTQNIGVITRLCKSNLIKLRGDNPVNIYSRAIWREVIQFFIINEVQISELNDLLDYINNKLARDNTFTLKGRTLHTLKRANQDWHWELNRVKRMGDAKWEAYPIENESFALKGYEHITWTMEQIVTSKQLAAEGTSMHHCVYSYQQRCINGSCVIWSLKKKINKKGYHIDVDRALTIEMDANSESLVQVRGFANRSPSSEESIAVKFWANKHGLKVKDRL